jgi:hypothetical protein
MVRNSADSASDYRLLHVTVVKWMRLKISWKFILSWPIFKLRDEMKIKRKFWSHLLQSNLQCYQDQTFCNSCCFWLIMPSGGNDKFIRQCLILQCLINPCVRACFRKGCCLPLQGLRNPWRKACFRKRCCLPIQDRRSSKRTKQLNYVQITWTKFSLNRRKHTENKKVCSFFCLL